jgi:type I restriction-modification system DNA methylase subunit
VPKEARWSHLKAQAPQPTIGKLVDDAMSAIERDNSTLKGVLPKDYGRPGLDKQRLGQIINLVSECEPPVTGALGSAPRLMSRSTTAGPLGKYPGQSAATCSGVRVPLLR